MKGELKLHRLKNVLKYRNSIHRKGGLTPYREELLWVC